MKALLTIFSHPARGAVFFPHWTMAGLSEHAGSWQDSFTE
jgi:hypothetical protein